MLRLLFVSIIFFSTQTIAQVFEGTDQFGRACSIEVFKEELVRTRLTAECLTLNRALSERFTCLERNTFVKVTAKRKEFFSSTKTFEYKFLLKSIDSDLYDAYEINRSSAQENGARIIVEFDKKKPGLFYFSESDRKELIQCRL